MTGGRGIQKKKGFNMVSLASYVGVPSSEAEISPPGSSRRQKQRKDKSQGKNADKHLTALCAYKLRGRNKVGRAWCPRGDVAMAMGYPSTRGGGEACPEANMQKINKQQGFLKTSLFTLHICLGRTSTAQSEDYYFFS